MFKGVLSVIDGHSSEWILPVNQCGPCLHWCRFLNLMLSAMMVQACCMIASNKVDGSLMCVNEKSC